MLNILCRKKGQGVSGEYVLVIALVSIAIIAMTTYVRRTLQGRYRDANRAVYIKAAGVLGNAVQAEYEPYYVNTSADTEADAKSEEKAAADGGVDKTDGSWRRVDSVSEQKPF